MDTIKENSYKNRYKTFLIGTCGFCSKYFNHFKWDDQRFCSKKCFSDYVKNNKSKVYCNVCNKMIEVTNSKISRNNKFYCSRECYDNRRKDVLKRLKRGTKYYKNLLENTPCQCGESKIYLLQIHHIDGNKKNNIQSNLEVVCSNCHVKRHLKKDKRGNWVYHPKTLTDRSLLEKL